MLLYAVSVLVVAQSSSKIPEGLMNNPVLTTVALASTNKALPDGGVTAPKHVGAVLMSILM